MRAVEAGTVDAHVPEVVHAEVVSALVKYVRAKLVAPKLGAEIVRLWCASTDYSGDLNIDDKILAKSAEQGRPKSRVKG